MAAPAFVIPKVIYTIWMQGKEQAPDLVKLILERWAALNPDYRLEILDQNDVETLLEGEGLEIGGLPFQALSDIARARLLLDTGGIWVDATLFPMRPLDHWLHELVAETGFFAFERPGPDRPIASWFLVASRDNQIVRRWWTEIRRFWSRPRSLVPGVPADPLSCVSIEGASATSEFPYHWFHYLFQFVINADPQSGALWSRCIKSSAIPPHRLQFLFRDVPNPSKGQIEEAAASAPVQKLDWRVTYPLDILAALK
jgi:hypothetical protein